MNEKPLFSLTDISPRDGLFEQVVTGIQAKRQVARLWRMRISVTAGLASLAGLVPALISVVRSFATSNFGVYMSLIFSDTAIALSHWKAIGLSLLESVPAAGIAVTLGLVGIAVWSVRNAIRSMGSISIIRHA